MIYNLVFNLLVAHVLGDFYFQSSKMCNDKVIYSYKGAALYIHALIIGILSWAAVWEGNAWWLALGVMTGHFVTDYLKSRLQLRCRVYTIQGSGTNARMVDGNNKRYDIRFFLLDQIVHVGVIVLLAYVWFYECKGNWRQFGWVDSLVETHPMRLKMAIALLLALKPANTVILLIMGACKVNVVTNSGGDHGNFHSGSLIGWMERGLILIFVVLAQYEAIGFLIAAKSILRFNETTSENEKSEYVLTGTLLSLAIALLLGLAVLRF